MKITTEDCIDAIVQKLKTSSPKDWKRLSKKGTGNNIIRVFQNKVTGEEILVRSSESEIFEIYKDESKTVQSFGNIKNYLREKVKELYKDGEDFYDLHHEIFYKVKNWPNVTPSDPDNTEGYTDDDLDTLDMENFEWISITNDKVIITCGGDWQDPLKLTIQLDNNNELIVTSYKKVGDNWKDGLDEDKFNEILGIDVDDNQIKRFRNF